MSQPFVITRDVAAPRDRVFAAWTEAEHLRQWFGPAGTTIQDCTMDLRPGGAFLYGMALPDGTSLWGKWVFREIVRPEHLVFTVNFSDPAGGVTRHPFAPDWPLHTLSTVSFADAGGATRVTIEWLPIDATEVEEAAFAAGHDGMQQGWTGTLDRLVDHLASPT